MSGGSPEDHEIRFNYFAATTRSLGFATYNFDQNLLIVVEIGPKKWNILEHCGTSLLSNKGVIARKLPTACGHP